MIRKHLSLFLALLVLPSAARAVTLSWLNQSAPVFDEGQSFGVPWPQGAVAHDQTFSVTDANGKAIAVQTWPLAYWPDGSLKWTGHAIAETDSSTSLTLMPGPAASPAVPIQVDQSDQAITINTGPMTCRIAKSGEYLIDSISLGGKVVANHGELICSREDRSQYETQGIIRQEDFVSRVDSVTLEQSGPVRAVVKVTGMHVSDSRSWLPFIVRLYFYAGVDSIKMVHTFIFDGNQDTDFIRGLGVRFGVPMREEFQNRHVRFAGEDGMFAEPIRLISGRRSPGAGLYSDQIAGKRVPNLADLRSGPIIADMAVWDSYKLIQISDGSYAIQKRTNPQSAWINSEDGRHSTGLAFVGDVSGGLALSLQNFWQLGPDEFQIDGASTDTAHLTLWLWSPDSPAMDMRHYDTKAHGLEASYEDVQPGFSTATGVARTSVLTIRPYASVPSDADLWKASLAGQRTPLWVCSPQYYHSIPIFGLWSLPDRSQPTKAWIEDELDKAITYYQGQIQQRHWYGFWDFGDVMHTYDPTRHEWRYDVGGFAWDNTELMPNLWLWYMFLRSGRPDIFEMAEAITRQTQEVDVYHLGPMAGLGSRHNVRHWGDGAKEVRISQSLLKRFYYYLTTDERTGDLMNEVINVDQKLVAVDPLREIDPKTQYPTHIRTGPDWFACVSNWYTAWERTGDTKYRDWIITGMKCYAAMPHGLFSTDRDGGYGYDPATHKIYPIFKSINNVGFTTLFGGAELNFEIDPVLNVPEWNKVWLQYCTYLSASPEEQRKVLGAAVGTGRTGDFARLPAYAAYITKDPALADRAWRMFLHAGDFGSNGSAATSDPFGSHVVKGPMVPSPVDEIQFSSTNSTAQWCLNAIELLQLVPDQIPAK